MACSGCGNRHDPDRCPHGTYPDMPSDWVLRAMADAAADRAYWEQDNDEEED